MCCHSPLCEPTTGNNSPSTCASCGAVSQAQQPASPVQLPAQMQLPTPVQPAPAHTQFPTPVQTAPAQTQIPTQVQPRWPRQPRELVSVWQQLGQRPVWVLEEAGPAASLPLQVLALRLAAEAAHLWHLAGAVWEAAFVRELAALVWETASVWHCYGNLRLCGSWLHWCGNLRLCGSWLGICVCAGAAGFAACAAAAASRASPATKRQLQDRAAQSC